MAGSIGLKDRLSAFLIQMKEKVIADLFSSMMS